MAIKKATLFQLLIVVVLSLTATVIGSKVNKERRKGHHHRDDDFGYISDSHGLPTKFGDEDDVVFAKKQQHNDSSALLPNPGSSSNGKPTGGLLGHGTDYDYDYDEDELEHPDENDSRDKDGAAIVTGTGGGGVGLDDYTDGLDGGGDAIDQIDSFGEGSDTTSALPVFLVEPQSSYVIKNRPAVLQCKASHAFQISFKCSGGNKPPLTTLETHVDPHTGVQLQEATTTITRELVDEFFGRGPFKCDCHARSSRGVVKTQPATIQVAYCRVQNHLTW